jgi:tripartite-type tricarboxylate transporter receptor subunit TctC
LYATATALREAKLALRTNEGEAMKLRSGLAYLFAIGLSLLALAGTRATAQDFPTKPVKFIVCFAAGGPNDIVARLFSQYLSEHFGQQFVVENRPGAGGNIGMASALPPRRTATPSSSSARTTSSTRRSTRSCRSI